MRQRPPRRPSHACAGSTGPCPCPRQMYCRDTRSEHPCSLPCCADVLTLSIHEPSALRQRYVGYGTRDSASNITASTVSCRSKRSEEHPSELQSLMSITNAVFCL